MSLLESADNGGSDRRETCLNVVFFALLILGSTNNFSKILTLIFFLHKLTNRFLARRISSCEEIPSLQDGLVLLLIAPWL